jgi:hypothetical protein
VLAVIGQLLPIALAVALSTVPITATITILLSPKASGSALLFLIGWVAGLIVVTVAFSLGARAAPDDRPIGATPLLAWVEVILGAGLAIVGVVSLVRRSTRLRATSAAGGETADSDAVDETDADAPRWLRLVETIKPVPALGLALAFNVRPKALLLAAAAGLVIGSSSIGFAQHAISLAIYVVLAGSSVIVPIVLWLVRPNAMRRPLRAAEAWVIRNSSTVSVIVAIVVGTFVLGNGLTRF